MQPKRMKHRKWHRVRSLNRTIATSGIHTVYGTHSLKAMEAHYLTDRQIESALKDMRRVLGKKGKAWLRIFPHLSRTKKPAEVRMGSGKGDVDHYATMVRVGKILFEAEATDPALAKLALRRAAFKLPIATKIIQHSDEK
ncbi:MAG: 50S ribosomal protein L16 [Parcubacteria group bacterium GW2011_GWC1_41_7]|nr:MAG: 50S ribosomal protein L16 [Parcubacteria group bacterium GW2011_GWC1_41_7]